MSKEHDPLPGQFTLEAVAEMAQATLRRTGAHRPTLIVEGYGQAGVVQVDHLAETPERRHWQMQRVGFELAKQEYGVIPQRVFFVTEGWLSVAEGGKTPHERPAQDPARKDVLIVSGLDVREAGARVLVYELRRDSEGLVIDVTPLPMRDEEGHESRAESPLLEAFVQGFAMGLMNDPND